MSSVESILPMLGVSSVVFQGIGLPNIGRPEMIVCPEARPTGGKRTTSYFERRSPSFDTSCVLM
jgi:hypothetical protein